MPSFIGFIPTPPGDVDVFFELAPVSQNDVVYDLGSGDGRLLFAALEKGAGRVVGIEIDPQKVREAREIAQSKGVEDKATFMEADVLDAVLKDATMVLCYLLPAASSALKSKFEKELKPGTRVIMEEFPVPGWIPAQTTWSKGYGQFYLYVMPPYLVP